MDFIMEVLKGRGQDWRVVASPISPNTQSVCRQINHGGKATNGLIHDIACFLSAWSH